jgi:hypothetical protein
VLATLARDRQLETFLQMKVAGYARVSTDEQADLGAGLEAQREAIRSEAGRRGWERVALHEDAASGRSLRGRAAAVPVSWRSPTVEPRGCTF